jgi:hypothetical protein
VECKILGHSLEFSWRLYKKELLPNNSLFVFIWDQTCLPKVKVTPFILIMIISPLPQMMRKYWMIWTKRTWLFFIAGQFFTTFMIFSHHMRLRKGQGNMWTQQLVFKMFWFKYEAQHMFIQDFEHLYLGGIWWICIFSIPNNLGPCMIFKWSFYFIFKVRVLSLIYFFFHFFHLRFNVFGVYF